MRANVYVDGLNLYYSALRRRFPDCKWLDVRALAETLFPRDEIGRVLYFTARVASRPDDPQEATRQQMYLRALTARDVEIVLGQFRSGTRWMRRAEPCPNGTDCPVSEDTDLTEPLRLARDDLGLTVALLSPSEHPARSLRTHADFVKKLRHGPVRASQLPPVLSDARGAIHRPRAWRPETLRPGSRAGPRTQPPKQLGGSCNEG